METEAVTATFHYIAGRSRERTSTHRYEMSMNKGISEISLCSAYYAPDPIWDGTETENVINCDRTMPEIVAQ